MTVTSRAAGAAVSFTAVLEGVPGSSATFVRVPDKVVRALGGRVHVPVRVVINRVEHRTTLANMGKVPMIGVPAALRKSASVERGDRIAILVAIDKEERTVDLPPDFAKAMRPGERRTYDAMSYTHRKEYVQWIEAAKKLETRARRIAVACERLREETTGSR